MEPQAPLMSANMTKHHSSSILFKKLVSIENDETDPSFNYDVSNTGWIKDKPSDEKEEKIDTETKIYTHGQKIDCQHPDSRSRWIHGTVVKETVKKIQIHFDGIGNDLQPEHLDEYIPDSDEDEWFDRKESTKISKLGTRTVSPISLLQPMFFLDQKYNPLIYIQSLNIILYQGYNEDIDYSSYSDSDDENDSKLNQRAYFIQSYSTNTDKCEKFIDYPDDCYPTNVKHVHYILDPVKCHLYVWCAEMMSILDVMNKKWLKNVKLKFEDQIEDVEQIDTIKRVTCYLSEPVDELHFYIGGMHFRYEYALESNQMESHKLGNMNAMVANLDDDDYYEIYKFGSTNSQLVYNRFIQRLFWFKFNTQSIYYCDISAGKMAYKEAVWKKHDLSMPYRSTIQKSEEEEDTDSSDDDSEHSEVVVDDDRWCILPCFEGEFIFLFYFAENNNEIWVMDVDAEKFYKSEKHLDVKNIMDFMENETISMVHAGDFIHCVDYGSREKHFKMSILDILPDTLMRLNALAPYGFIREYNEGQKNMRLMVPENIMQVILHFYARFLFHVNFIK